LYVVGLVHSSNGFDDLLKNHLTTPELTVEDGGRLMDLQLSNERSVYARLDVYLANSLGHYLPGRIHRSTLPLTRGNETTQVHV